MEFSQSDDFLEGMFAEQGKPTTLPDTEIEENDIDQDLPITDDAPKAEEVTDDTPIKNYVDFLQQNELIEIPEGLEFSGKPEELEQIFEHTKATQVARAVDKVFETLPDSFKPLFDYALRGGSSIADYMKVHNNELESLNLENEDDQRKVLYQYYKKTSPYPDEKINRLISLVSDPEELAVEAKDAFQDLLAIRDTEQKQLVMNMEKSRAEQEQRAQQQTIELAKAIETSTTIIPQRKNKIKAFFFDPVQVNNQTTTGFNYTIQSILENPDHQAQLADILLEYDKGTGFSFDRLEKRARTKATQQFQTALQKISDPKQNQRSSTSPSRTTSDMDWQGYLEQNN